MTFHKSFVLAAHNWKVMLKALICQIIILAFIAALCLLIFGGLIGDILEAFSSLDLASFIKDLVESLTNQAFDAEIFSQKLTEMIANIRDAIETVPNVWNRVEVSYVICLVLLFVYRMLISFSDITVGFEINEFMTSNASRPFTWYFVKKFGTSWKFISLQVLLTLPLDVLLALSGISVFILMALFIGWWAVIPAGLLLLVLYALRHTLFAFWLPSVVSDELGVGKSLTQGVSAIPRRFGQVFWKTLILVLCMVVITVVSIVYLHNPILKLVVGTVPNLVLFFWLKCVNLVEYFEVTKRPYFCKLVDVEGTERFNRKAQRRHRRGAKKA